MPQGQSSQCFTKAIKLGHVTLGYCPTELLIGVDRQRLQGDVVLLVRVVLGSAFVQEEQVSALEHQDAQLQHTWPGEQLLVRDQHVVVQVVKPVHQLLFFCDRQGQT